MRLLVVEPLYGLANRMRVLMSALALAEANDAAVEVLWRRNRDLNCQFAKLFRQPQRIRFVHDRAMHQSVAKYLGIMRHWSHSFSPRKRGLLSLGNWECRKHINQLHDEPWIKRAETLWVGTCFPFGKGWDDPKWLQPLEHFQDRASMMAAEFGKRCIGVHVRGTDHITRLKTIFPRFIERMKQEISAEPETRFFLSTDEPECQDELIRRFPGRIITYAKRSLRRGDPAGIEDALTDMLCLSRTTKLIGTFRSSFSRVSSILGKIECEFIE